MRTFLWIFVVLTLVATLKSNYLGQASQEAQSNSLDIHEVLVQKLIDGEYSTRGADVCLGCHDEEESFPTLAVFKTIHGHPSLEDSPFHTHADSNFPEGLQCEACHGPVGEHGRKFLNEGETRESMLNFGVRANVDTELQNQMCLACHDDYNRAHWLHSEHEASDLACADCHQIHSEVDPVRSVATHNKVCASCHQDVAWEAGRLSSHPMMANQLVCRDCHDPHGGNVNSSSLIRETTINQLCANCHLEITGPFLWEHPPVVEDCATCHEPHGSNNRALLKMDVPQLCQSCHTSPGHRSLRMNPDLKPTEFGGEFLFLSACLNCHSSIHGSNHPSGNLFRR